MALRNKHVKAVRSCLGSAMRHAASESDDQVKWTCRWTASSSRGRVRLASEIGEYRPALVLGRGGRANCINSLRMRECAGLADDRLQRTLLGRVELVVEEILRLTGNHGQRIIDLVARACRKFGQGRSVSSTFRRSFSLVC